MYRANEQKGNQIKQINLKIHQLNQENIELQKKIKNFESVKKLSDEKIVELNNLLTSSKVAAISEVKQLEKRNFELSIGIKFLD